MASVGSVKTLTASVRDGMRQVTALDLRMYLPCSNCLIFRSNAVLRRTAVRLILTILVIRPAIRDAGKRAVIICQDIVLGLLV